MRPACRNGRIAALNNAKIILFIRKKKDYDKSLNKMSSQVYHQPKRIQPSPVKQHNSLHFTTDELTCLNLINNFHIWVHPTKVVTTDDISLLAYEYSILVQLPYIPTV